MRLLGVNRGHQNEERKALRGEPFSAGASAFAGPGLPSLSEHVADLLGFFALAKLNSKAELITGQQFSNSRPYEP